MRNLESLNNSKFTLSTADLNDITGGAPWWVREGNHRFLWKTWTTTIDTWSTGNAHSAGHTYESVQRCSDPK